MPGPTPAYDGGELVIACLHGTASCRRWSADVAAGPLAAIRTPNITILFHFPDGVRHGPMALNLFLAYRGPRTRPAASFGAAADAVPGSADERGAGTAAATGPFDDEAVQLLEQAMSPRPRPGGSRRRIPFRGSHADLRAANRRGELPFEPAAHGRGSLTVGMNAIIRARSSAPALGGASRPPERRPSNLRIVDYEKSEVGALIGRRRGDSSTGSVWAAAGAT